MTPHERAKAIVERFFATPEGYAPDDKKALTAAIEQGMNEVLEDAATKLGKEADILARLSRETSNAEKSKNLSICSEMWCDQASALLTLKSTTDKQGSEE